MRRRRTAATALAGTALAMTLAACTGTSGGADDGGPGPTAGPTTAAPSVPAVAGVAPSQRFAVGVRELKLARGGNRPLPTTVWYPATGTAGDAPKRSARAADGRFPVVVFSHGLTARPADYRPLLLPWAAAGFVVVAPAYPHTSRGAPSYQVLDVVNQPADASYVLDEVLRLDTRDGDPLRGHLDTDRVAAAGHSAGGVTTIGLFTVGRDERLDAGIVLAGTALGVGTAFGGPAAPQLFVHGRADNVVSYAAGRAAYDRVPWPKAMLTLPKGDHVGALLGNDDGALDVVTGSTVEFLRWTLYGDPAAKRRLPDRAARGGLATLDDHL
ncbi:alpha/beta hydrolase family protein [Plantactinospora sp. CA-290183]|uniref:alpha/beta hydrolase family protein n=1 Tax=Plantactinospora sp. CA-290183 TaxID=3240006 RepID=UPI003D90F855